MDRKLILSVAGSGKTQLLIDHLDRDRRFLIVTYTNKNIDNLKRRIRRRFGCLPKNITIYTYFEFLVAVCYRPFFSDRVKAKGICWNLPNPESLKYSRGNPAFYINSCRYLYHNRIALICGRQSGEIRNRIAKYYDCFFYDEAQDLDGHDFNLILKIIPENINALFVGDFFQHTFSTSNDGNINKGLYEKLSKYKKRWEDAGFEIDETTLINSHRCSSSICQFVRDKMGIDIYSANNNISEIREVETKEEADILIKNDLVPKLFFREACKYSCYSINWGDSKGLDDFEDVCVVLNGNTLNALHSDNLKNLAHTTKNKLYVACTRARRNIYFISLSFLEKYKKE